MNIEELLAKINSRIYIPEQIKAAIMTLIEKN